MAIEWAYNGPDLEACAVEGDVAWYAHIDERPAGVWLAAFEYWVLDVLCEQTTWTRDTKAKAVACVQRHVDEREELARLRVENATLRELRAAVALAHAATEAAHTAWDSRGAECCCPIFECAEHTSVNAAMNEATAHLDAALAATVQR